MNEEIFSMREVIIFNVIWAILLVIMIILSIPQFDNLEKQVEEYKTLYEDERIVSRVIRNSCDCK